GAEVVVPILRDYVPDLVREHLRAQFPAVAKKQVQLEAAVQFVVGAFIGQGIWWLVNEIPYCAGGWPGVGGGIPGVPAWGQANHAFEVSGEVGLIVEAGLGGNRGDR